MQTITLPQKTDARVEFHRVPEIPLPESFTEGKQFARVHVRIHCPSYCLNGAPGFHSQDEKQAFQAAAVDLLQTVGLASKVAHYWVSDSRDERLHAHPDDLSGTVSIERLNSLLAELPQYASIFTLRWVDIYELPEYVDDSEKLLRLNHYRLSVAREVLTRFATGKKLSFKRDGKGVAMDVISRFRGLEFMELQGPQPRACATTSRFLDTLLDDLVAQRLVHTLEREGTIYFRTAIKGELRAIPKASRGSLYSLAEDLLWPSKPNRSNQDAFRVVSA